MRNYLLMNHLHIQNANALSSPYTIGFPAMTAWLGAVHALQRNLRQQGMQDVSLTKMAVICHDFILQTYRGKNDYVYSIIGTANPADKDGERPSFIEEARCHLNVSLLIETEGINGDNETDFLRLVRKQLYKMKMASGDVLSDKSIEALYVDDNDERQVRACIRKLMPGYVLIERRDLMTASMEEGKDALEALVDHVKVMYQSNKSCEQTDDNGIKSISWKGSKKEPGWIVPIAVGFHGISQLGIAENQRDETTEHRFAESIVTLGEFKMPYRVRSLDEMMWEYNVYLEQNLYVCKNQQIN